jgi:hypothetical protein
VLLASEPQAPEAQHLFRKALVEWLYAARLRSDHVRNEVLARYRWLSWTDVRMMQAMLWFLRQHSCGDVVGTKRSDRFFDVLIPLLQHPRHVATTFELARLMEHHLTGLKWSNPARY